MRFIEYLSHQPGCLQAQVRAGDAEPLYRKGLEISLVALGEAHPAVGISYNNLASCLEAQGRDAEAAEMWRHIQSRLKPPST